MRLQPFVSLALAAITAVSALPAQQTRTIAIDARLAADAGLHVGDLVVLSAQPGEPGDTVRVAAITKPNADPSEIAHQEYRVRMHLDQLQTLTGYGDRVHRFAVQTNGGAYTDRAVAAIDAAAFGFVAHRSRDVAVETSATFAVVSRFHRAIGVITVVASAIFLLCILLLKVDERRKDVAALRLSGISRATVVKSIVIEASVIALFGTIFGALLGWLATAIVNAHYQGVYRTPLRFALVTPQTIGFALVLSVVLGVVAGALAALRLARAHPLALLGRR
ncbi:MAG: FtsX-like permease family protein [Gemmatimonadaceae bacterium]|nr:FtsX-like permease family protein [Gemmatimonadaceae bacterium]